MGIMHAQESAFVKEMRKWEHRPVMIGDTFIRPIPIEAGGKENYPFQEYPKMLYRASRADGGPIVDGFLTVQNDGEERLQTGRGWSVTQQEALDLVAAQDLEFARLAANRAHVERRMSEAARKEAQAADDASLEHVPVVPDTPIKRRGGRPKKTAVTT